MWQLCWAAKLSAWVRGWHHADFLSIACKGISDNPRAVETVNWDLRVRMGIFSAEAQMCELAWTESKLSVFFRFLSCRPAWNWNVICRQSPSVSQSYLTKTWMACLLQPTLRRTERKSCQTRCSPACLASLNLRAHLQWSCSLHGRTYPPLGQWQETSNPKDRGQKT